MFVFLSSCSVCVIYVHRHIQLIFFSSASCLAIFFCSVPSSSLVRVLSLYPSPYFLLSCLSCFHCLLFFFFSLTQLSTLCSSTIQSIFYSSLFTIFHPSHVLFLLPFMLFSTPLLSPPLSQFFNLFFSQTLTQFSSLPLFTFHLVHVSFPSPPLFTQVTAFLSPHIMPKLLALVTSRSQQLSLNYCLGHSLLRPEWRKPISRTNTRYGPAQDESAAAATTQFLSRREEQTAPLSTPISGRWRRRRR